MTYDVGTKISLAHLNKKESAEPPTIKPPSYYEAGTELVFRFVSDRMVVARRIKVSFA